MAQQIETDRGRLLVTPTFARCIERGDMIITNASRVREISGHAQIQHLVMLFDRHGVGILRNVNDVVQRVVGARAGGGIGGI